MRYYVGHTDEDTLDGLLSGSLDSLGFTEFRRKSAASVSPGDVFVCYLYGASKWCGVLEVIGPILPAHDPRVGLNSRWPVRFPVKPRVLLRPEESIPVKDQNLWLQLECTRDTTLGSVGWARKTGLSNDLEELSQADGQLLVQTLSARTGGIPRAGDAYSGPWDPRDFIDARERIMRGIVYRRGQQAFRDALLDCYDRACAITGCSVVDVLEAAHITPDLGAHTNHVTNGLLLRSDLHTLFDCQLIAIEPVRRIVLLHPRLRASEYACWHQKPLRCPRDISAAPSEAAILQHFQDCGISE